MVPRFQLIRRIMGEMGESAIEIAAAQHSAEPAGAGALSCADLPPPSAVKAGEVQVEMDSAFVQLSKIPKTESHLQNKIEDLKKAQKRLREERRQTATTLKATERKASRIRVKAAQLSDADLLEVVRMRQKKIEVRGARSEVESAPVVRDVE